MNRIILIGNGFDLAHGLETNYDSFINSLWKQTLQEISFEQQCESIVGGHYRPIVYKGKHELTEFILPIGGENYFKDVNDYKSLKTLCTGFNTAPWENKMNHILQAISEENKIYTWYDVEEVYYELLCNCSKLETNKLNEEIKKININITKLNKDFKVIQNYLEMYLNNIQNQYQENDNLIKKHDEIYKHIYSQFKKNDFTTEGYKIVSNEEYSKFLKYKQYDPNDPGIPFDRETKMKYLDFDDFWKDHENPEFFQRQLNLHPYNFELLPDNILFLSFNYTTTEKNYNNPRMITTKHIDISVNHIHGELNSNDNPIIFGYGDELCERYKEIEKLNDNHYLENIKSIKYLNTDNYKKVLRFIDSEPYQIFIFGHSCGNSDRTLLNTLFEHENCYSIKPFYYQYYEENDGGIKEIKDNYSDIVRNISRSFDKKSVMRKKVVDKTNCEPLLKI